MVGVCFIASKDKCGEINLFGNEMRQRLGKEEEERKTKNLLSRKKKFHPAHSLNPSMVVTKAQLGLAAFMVYRLFFMRSIVQFFTQIYMNCLVSL